MGRFLSSRCVLLWATLLIGLTIGLPTEVSIPILKPMDTGDSAVFDENDTVIIDAEDTDSTTTQPENNESDSDSEFDPSDCLLPKSKGPCRAVIESFYFNSVTKNCELFLWSGCGGNNNRFREKSYCENHCAIGNFQGNSSTTTSSEATSSPSPSTTTSVPTVTRKHKLPDCPKFDGCPNKCVIIQDRSDRGCKKCLCGSSASDPKISPTIVAKSKNGTLKEEKEIPILSPVGSVSGYPKDGDAEFEDARTSGGAIENCKLPTRRGNCRGMLTRFRYDPALKDCLEFHYGGCDGNLNNFVTREKCLEYCKEQ